MSRPKIAIIGVKRDPNAPKPIRIETAEQYSEFFNCDPPPWFYTPAFVVPFAALELALPEGLDPSLWRAEPDEVAEPYPYRPHVDADEIQVEACRICGRSVSFLSASLTDVVCTHCAENGK
jgi:hypothetical protein